MASIQLKFGTSFTGYCRTNPVDFAECWIHSFFYRSIKKISYALQPMESNSLKDQTVHSIVIKFSINIIHRALHIASILVSLELIVLFTGSQKEFLYITA